MGERQIVEIARLMVRDARLWILDEPTATLSDVEIARMMAALRALKAKGSSILYVTHRLGEIFEICDSVTVLRNGRHVTTRAVAGLERRELIALMLGRRFEEMYPAPRSHSSTSQGLTISSLRIPGIVEDFSIFAPRGEVTCIAGQVGAGAATIIRSLAGLIPEATGRIHLDGVALPIGSVRKRVRRNVAFVSEDRAREGLFRRSVLENLAATHFPKCRRTGLLSWSKVRRFASDVCPRVMLDGNRLDADAFDLSGGNQQKILFARAFGIEQPGVILINEPTRGVDVGAARRNLPSASRILPDGLCLVDDVIGSGRGRRHFRQCRHHVSRQGDITLRTRSNRHVYHTHRYHPPSRHGIVSFE